MSALRCFITSKAKLKKKYRIQRRNTPTRGVVRVQSQLVLSAHRVCCSRVAEGGAAGSAAWSALGTLTPSRSSSTMHLDDDSEDEERALQLQRIQARHGDGAMGRCERLTLAWLIVAVVFVLGKMALKDIRHQW